MSSFRGVDLFGSGPHRTRLGKRFLRKLPLSVVLSNSPEESGLVVVGDGDFEIEIAGRLVAASESTLWGLRSAIIGQVRESLGTGTLVDTFGRTWEGVRLSEYVEDGRVDVGRSWSVGYVATFGWFDVDQTA